MRKKGWKMKHEGGKMKSFFYKMKKLRTSSFILYLFFYLYISGFSDVIGD